MSDTDTNADKGMFVERDTFTDDDRHMLRDLQHREHERAITHVADVPDGTIVQGWERREVFTFDEPSVGTLRFDVRGIKDGILAGRIPTAMYRLEDIPEHFYQHVLANNGVEPERLPKLTKRDLERPGIMVMWPGSEHSTLIDGNHRLCRRYQLGQKNFRFLMVHLSSCTDHICRPGDEAKLFGEREHPGVEVLHSEIKIEE